jgi:hypothetical protein
MWRCRLNYGNSTTTACDDAFDLESLDLCQGRFMSATRQPCSRQPTKRIEGASPLRNEWAGIDQRCISTTGSSAQAVKLVRSASLLGRPWLVAISAFSGDSVCSSRPCSRLPILLVSESSALRRRYLKAQTVHPISRPFIMPSPISVFVVQAEKREMSKSNETINRQINHIVTTCQCGKL